MENCFHCGDPCELSKVSYLDKQFCCYGCKTVFEIFNENNLEYYYDLENNPGTSPRDFEYKFDFLDNQSIVEKLLEFSNETTQILSFLIPTIHCSSCIWVLENLNKLNPEIKNSQVNFPEKTVRITCSNKISIKELAYLLSKIGYQPHITLENTAKTKKYKDRSLIYKVGVAGFAFGNVMFLSFPEYFEANEFWLEQFKHTFRWLMFIFSVPVVFYSGRDYFISAFKGVRSKILNIDVPIALGISVLFIRSTLDILFNWGSGFFDSLTGLIFFLLLGKFFQQKTYSYLSFERDYKSYFPIAVTRLKKAFKNKVVEEQTEVYKIAKGDRILIRNNELIPVDGILIKGNALIDYSFVTGEAVPVSLKSGDKIFAGGRQQAGILEVEVLNPVKQSYLTQLWSDEVFNKQRVDAFRSLTDLISKRFTIIVLLITAIATSYWLIYNPNIAFNVFTAVLIVACPCAIALAAPFTLGNLLRIFGQNKVYLKEAPVIEKIAAIDTVVFDKTGTLTTNNQNGVTYEGIALTIEEEELLTSTLRASNHPLSRALYSILEANAIKTLDDFEEEIGRGISGKLDNKIIKIGSYDFVENEKREKSTTPKNNKTVVHISSDNEYKGYYIFHNQYREGLSNIFKKLSRNKEIIILSGDNDGEYKYLKKMLPSGTKMFFNQKPEEKLQFVKKLQENGKNVMMVGDGLNDAGALKQSNVGITISENINIFSPACDGIVGAEMFKKIPNIFSLSQKGIQIIKWSFILSLIYNLVGLGFALTGNLVPVVAAILMPLSSISIVVFTTILTQIAGKEIKKEIIN